MDAAAAVVVGSWFGDALEVGLPTTFGPIFGMRCTLFTDFIANEEIGANLISFVRC